MSAIRLRVQASSDGVLHLRGLPIRKGEEADVIVLTDIDDDNPDETTLAILRHDPSWTWLHDPSEDIYSEGDVRPDAQR